MVMECPLCARGLTSLFSCPSQQFDKSGSVTPIVQMRKLGQKCSVMGPHSKQIVKLTKPRPASVLLIMLEWSRACWEGSQVLSSVPICWPEPEIPSLLLCCFGLNPGSCQC